MNSCDLTKWSIFSLLEPKFISNIHMAVVYGNIGNEALIVTKDKMVYAVGSNTSGCLGTGDTQSTLYPKKIKELCGKDIKTFAYGKGPHVLALTEEGKVYSWGQNCHYELGNTFNNQALTPGIITNLCNEFIIDIACGSHHSLALTNDGEVYAWGQNTSGQVGCHDDTTLVQDIPRKLNFTLTGKKVICISCGDSFSMVVTNNGEVYSWGCNDVGQLGIENNNDQFHPCKITSLAKIVIEKVVCGSIHTLALSDEGVLYVWGDNNYGQLGLTTVLLNIWKPTKLEVPEMRRVLDIATSYYNYISIALCEAVMHQPLIFHSDEESNLINSLREAFDDPTTSDLIIQVHGNPIHVHKAILKIRCHYFRTMFQEHWAENSQSVICHEQFSYDVYKTFLKYLYTNEIDPFLDPFNALELLDLANAYSENQLKRYCIQIINKGITVTNVIVLYNTSIQYNAKELEEHCFKFALNHMTAVVQTADFAKLDESTVKTFIIKAAQAGVFKT